MCWLTDEPVTYCICYVKNNENSADLAKLSNEILIFHITNCLQAIQIKKKLLDSTV